MGIIYANYVKYATLGTPMGFLCPSPHWEMGPSSSWSQAAWPYSTSILWLIIHPHPAWGLNLSVFSQGQCWAFLPPLGGTPGAPSCCWMSIPIGPPNSFDSTSSCIFPKLTREWPTTRNHKHGPSISPAECRTHRCTRHHTHLKA